MNVQSMIVSNDGFIKHSVLQIMLLTKNEYTISMLSQSSSR